MNREPPHDLDAEAALLGSMMLSVDAADGAIRALIPADFFRHQHALIFTAAVRARSVGPVDAYTICEALGPDLEAVGGKGAIVDIQADCPASSSWPRYCADIAACSDARRVILKCAEIADAAYARREDPIRFAQEAFASMTPAGEAPMPANLFDTDEFLARAEVAREPYIVPGLIRGGHRQIVVAPEGQGKMVLLAQIALCAARGVHPFTLEPIPPVSTLIVSLENPIDAVDEHVRRTLDALARRPFAERAGSLVWHEQGGLDLRSRKGRAELETVIAGKRPQLVVYGPLYRSGTGRRGVENWEDGVAEIQAVFDSLTARYGCGWIFEAHAPAGEGAGRREMRPYGSVQWRHWPDLGIGLVPDGEADHRGHHHRLKVRPFRGARVAGVAWPMQLERGVPSRGDLPWVATYPTGTLNRPDQPDFGEF